MSSSISMTPTRTTFESPIPGVPACAARPTATGDVDQLMPMVESGTAASCRICLCLLTPSSCTARHRTELTTSTFFTPPAALGPGSPCGRGGPRRGAARGSCQIHTGTSARSLALAARSAAFLCSLRSHRQDRWSMFGNRRAVRSVWRTARGQPCRTMSLANSVS